MENGGCLRGQGHGPAAGRPLSRGRRALADRVLSLAQNLTAARARAPRQERPPRSPPGPGKPRSRSPARAPAPHPSARRRSSSLAAESGTLAAPLAGGHGEASGTEGRAVSGGRALLREMVPEARTLAPRGGDGDRFWTQPGRGARRPAGLLPPAALACSTAGRLGVLSKAPTVTSSCRWSATATPLPRRACCPSSPAHTLPLAVPSSLARPLPWLPSQRVPRSASHLSLGSGKPQLGAGAS